MMKKKPTIIVGIDPGQKGGIALLYFSAVQHPSIPLMTQVMKMPLVHRSKSIDGCCIASDIRSSTRQNLIVYIEKSKAFPKQGATSAHTTGVNEGLLIGIMQALQVEYHMIDPRVWSKFIFKKTFNSRKLKKKMAVEYARRLYPKVAHEITTDGIADALLIAHYGKNHAS